MRRAGDERAFRVAAPGRSAASGRSVAPGRSAASGRSVASGGSAGRGVAREATPQAADLGRAGAPRQRRPQARALATRARLLAAAEELFTRQGEDATTVQEISLRAGVGVGTFYHHFADKRALLLELIDRYGEAVAARRRRELDLSTFLGDDPRGAIRRWLLRAYERLRDQPTLYLVILALAERDAEVRQRYRRIEELAIERWRMLLELAQSRGLARRDMAAGPAAFLIHHAIDMAAMQLLVHDRSDPAPEAVLNELGEMICRYITEDAG